MEYQLKNKPIKKVKIGSSISTIQMANQNTGEVEEYTVIDKNIEQDINFHKVWLMDVLNVLDTLGSAKIRLITFLLKQMRSADNTISVGTFREISEDTGISYPTIQKTMSELMNGDVIKKIRTGTYQFNPDLIMQGDTTKRKNLLIRYHYPEDQILGSKPYIDEKKDEHKNQGVLPYIEIEEDEQK